MNGPRTKGTNKNKMRIKSSGKRYLAEFRDVFEKKIRHVFICHASTRVHEGIKTIDLN